MLELLASVVGGFAVGTGINIVREGVKFRPFHSPKARKKFEQTYKKDIKKRMKSIHFTKDELDVKWYDR